MFVFHVIITIVIISCHHSEPGGGIAARKHPLPWCRTIHGHKIMGKTSLPRHTNLSPAWHT